MSTICLMAREIRCFCGLAVLITGLHLKTKKGEAEPEGPTPPRTGGKI